MAAYQELEAVFARAAILQDVSGMLHWDTETMMPPGAIESRSEQLAGLEDLQHETIAAPRVGELIEAALAAASDLDQWQRANLREMQRAHIRATAIPSDLLIAAAKANAICQHAWQRARKDNDFQAVKSKLAEVVKLQRETGQVVGEALGLSPYDALLDQFDSGAKAEAIDNLFAPIREALPGLIGEAVAKQALNPAAPPAGPFAVAGQEALCRTLLDRLGFDFDHGRLDVSAHPFTGGSFGDVRVTTRFDEGSFLPALMATIHEGGHALYEQGRPHEWRLQPVGVSKGMGVHESQSMIIELQAGRHDRFLPYLASLVRGAFGDGSAAWSDDNIRRVVRHVEPGFIRVDADELTYPAHILIRYGIEKALVAGELDVDDLPEAFNAAVAEMLGLTVPDDQHGCLQDIHWYGGAYGYFPMYLVGAITAAQLFVAAAAARPEVEPALGAGDFAPLVSWLRENIHSKASLHDREQLIEAATGAPTSAAPFLSHLRRRYIES